MTKLRTFTVQVPSRSKRTLKRPSRIYDKDDNVMFEGGNETANIIWGKLLAASSALDPPTPEESKALQRASRFDPR